MTISCRAQLLASSLYTQDWHKKYILFMSLDIYADTIEDVAISALAPKYLMNMQ